MFPNQTLANGKVICKICLSVPVENDAELIQHQEKYPI
jgi:hypothetical protein